MILDDCLSQPLAWHRTGRAEFPYAATVTGQAWLIRLNDFPAEPMYTLLIEGQDIGDFDEWPARWQRPN